MLYIYVSVMGFSEESFYKSTYKKIYELFSARTEYMKQLSGHAGIDSDNERKSLQKLDNFLG